jgi:hypothetical protein
MQKLSDIPRFRYWMKLIKAQEADITPSRVDPDYEPDPDRDYEEKGQYDNA